MNATFAWFSVLAVVYFWGWLVRRGFKATNRRDKLAFFGLSLMILLALLRNVYLALNYSN